MQSTIEAEDVRLQASSAVVAEADQRVAAAREEAKNDRERRKAAEGTLGDRSFMLWDLLQECKALDEMPPTMEARVKDIERELTKKSKR